MSTKTRKLYGQRLILLSSEIDQSLSKLVSLLLIIFPVFHCVIKLNALTIQLKCYRILMWISAEKWIGQFYAIWYFEFLGVLISYLLQF